VPKLYERPGGHYATHRRTDPRWAAHIRDALGDAAVVVNVGAGLGSYEPTDRRVVAVEPAAGMIAQRPAGSAPVVRGVAEALPLANDVADAAMAVLTVHHWRDLAAGIAEMRRVARRLVVVTWDPALVGTRFWFVRDYLPEVMAHEAGLATLDDVRRHLRGADVRPLPVPSDCTDGFFAAYWARPHAYRDPTVRAAISGLALLDQRLVTAAVDRLGRDLESGRWDATYADLAGRTELDVGYRLVVADA
jgi:SAM-dependent methyltransferase